MHMSAFGAQDSPGPEIVILVAWQVVNVRGAEPSPGRDTAVAAVVEVQRGGTARQILVELAETAQVAGHMLNARAAVREFLDHEDPPSHLIVTTHGVSIVA
jgi:hypothetical protein